MQKRGKSWGSTSFGPVPHIVDLRTCQAPAAEKGEGKDIGLSFNMHILFHFHFQLQNLEIKLKGMQAQFLLVVKSSQLTFHELVASPPN